MNACCTIPNSPGPRVSPSTVVTLRPLACTAKSRHDRTALSSSSTVQLPHAPCSQPRCVPVRPQSSRKKSPNVLRGSMLALCAVPLTVTETDISAIGGLRSRVGHCPTDQHRARISAIPARCMHIVRWVETAYRHLCDLLECRGVELFATAPDQGLLGR